MNKVYRIVWNARTNTWTAVQENAKAKGKSSSGRVSAEPATLGGLGLKSSRFVCTALASALMMTAGYANAGPGIFINDGDDGGCIVTSDESARRNALFFLTNNNLEWAAGQVSGGSMPSANAFRNKCSPGDAASQTNRALFHGDAGGAGSKHLSLGGRLDVNSGIIGLGDRAAGNNSIRIGSGNTLQAANSQSNSVAIGNDVETKAAMAVAIGPTAKANGQQSVAVGNSVEASGNFGVAIGTSARANAPQTVALGNNANAAGEDALAIGRSAHAQAKDSIAFGRSSQAAATGVAIGSQASAAVANSVALGSGTTSVAATDQSGTKNVNGLNYTYVGNSANSSVAVGNRQIKQVGAGEVSAASTDAVNGSQLYATQNVIGNIGKGVATNLGGGAALKPDGTFTAPTYNLTDANGNAVSKNNVGDALNVLNSRLGTVGGGFQVAAATGATQTVKPGNTLKFIDGTNTTTEVSTDGAGVTTVKINATAVALTNNATTGQVNAPTAADANKAATAGSVAAAINTAVGKSGFNVEGGSVAGGTATGTATSRVNNNDTVKLQAGKNIALAQNGKEFTFGTVEDMEVTSIKAGTAGTNAKLDRDGLTITSSGNPVKLTNNGLNNGDHTIVGVAAGTVNATSTEAVNGSQLHKTANSTATHLGGGSAIQSDGSISAPTYSLTDSTGATVTKNNVGDALDVLNSRMNTVGTPVALNSNPSTGQVAAPTAADANKAATAGSVATAVNNAVSALESKGLQIDADSGTVDTVALGETVKYAGDANIKTKVTDNQIGFSLADNLNVTSITTGDSKLDTDGLTITGGPSVTKTGINAGGKTITNVTAGTISATSTDAATGGQVYGALNNVKNVLGSNVSIDGSGNLSGNNIGGTGKTTFSDAIAAAYDKANSAAAGWKFQVNGAAEQTIEPTNTVKFLNGRNIELSNNGKDITVATKADLTADSLTINNGPVINGSGINTNGKNINMGNGKITNLTSGNVAAGDDSAVTGGAVNTAINTAINTAVTDLKDAGFKIGADSGADDTVKLGETVKYAGDANIKTTVTDNQIGFKLADSITVGPASGGNPVTVDGTAGTVTGLTNKTWNPASITSGRAATEDQLKAVTNQLNSSATHYYSVNDGGGAHGGNFNNDGATGLNALAAGVGASAQDNDAVAIGSGTIAQGNGSIAIGAAAEVSGATGAGGIAIGASATAKNGGTAVGSGADTGNGTALIPGLPNRLNNNLALGDSARVKNDTNFNVALGSLSTAGDADLTAAAYKPNATSVIAGDINEAGVKYGEVSLGGDTSHFMSGSKMYRRLTNLAAGSADTDAVNVSQLKAVQAALQDQAPVAYTKADGTKVYKHTDGNFYDAPNGAGNQVAAADVITSLQDAAGSTTAPTTLANVKDNLADTAAAVTNPTGNDRTTLSANKGHNAATVNDVLNAGFTVQGNGVDKDFVTHGDTVNFVNGQGTVANVSSTGGVTTVKFDTPMTYVDTAGTPTSTPTNKVNLVGTGGPVTLGNVAAGAVNATSTDAVNGGQLHNSLDSMKNILGGNATNVSGSLSMSNIGGTGKGTIHDAIAEVNNKAATANAGWKFQVNNGAAETIRPNDTVGFKDGTNIAITNNGKDITIATKPDLVADSLTINGNGPVINGNGINTNGKNIDMGNSGKITNLADGSIAAGSKDAITGGQLHTALNNISNAATNLIGTTQPDIVTYDVSGNKADNTNNVKQAIDKMNNGGIRFFHVNDGTGTQTTAGTQPATEDSSASGRYGTAVGYQANASGESGVAIGKGAQATAKNTISIGTGNIVSGEGSGAIGDPTIITGAGTYTIGNNNGTVSANAAGAFGNDNTLTGHNSRIIGNHNIVNTENTFVVGNNVSRATANSVVLGNNSSAERVHTTATTPGSNYTFGGLNDANVAGVNNVVGVVSVGQGAAGSDASVETRQIQNVAAGVVSATSTDAINGSQLYHTNQAILNGVNGNLANLGARIGQVEDAANAGTAAAMAMAGLPQAYLPGKSMMAVGGSVYRGESGYAIGYSTISDGGNWIIKGTATGNSRGHYGATAAVGYQW